MESFFFIIFICILSSLLVSLRVSGSRWNRNCPIFVSQALSSTTSIVIPVRKQEDLKEYK